MCYTCLSMEEAQEHPHNVAREALLILMDLINQMLHQDTPRQISNKHNAKEIGSDNLEICSSEFGLDPDCFKLKKFILFLKVISLRLACIHIHQSGNLRYYMI
jgi:hypothetical protein